MKKILKIILPLLLIFWFLFSTVQAWIVEIPTSEKITDVSIDAPITNNLVNNVNNIGFSLLRTVKLILSWVLLIFIVYIWIQMIISMWNDEEELSKAKRQIWYSGIWLVFINIPWSIYEVLKRENPWNLDNRIWYNSWISDDNDSNIFFDFFDFWYTFNENIIWFLEVLIFGIAIFMLVLTWIRFMTSRWRDERIKEMKDRITHSIMALIFVWFIEAWKYFAFKWKISDGKEVFETLSNLALFFAWPVAIFFLTLAWYYYITSNGDEERVKKAKSIVINTVIATVILIASYTFLLDLADLFR